VGRDVGRDEGREQAEWRDLVARLELQAPVDPAQAPWPDRESLGAKTQPGAGGPAAGGPGTAGTDNAADETAHDHSDDGDAGHGERGSADRSRVIRPSGFMRLGGPAEAAATTGAETSQAPEPGADEPAEARTAGTDEPTLGGPRDYELDEPGEDDLDEEWDGTYIPPPLPPQPSLDPVAKGAWLALFGGPGYLLIATLLNWQIAGWAALTAVIAFVAGFVVLVFRLGDGPSKRDGPDQGAVV
jgi:hypothetical protein